MRAVAGTFVADEAGVTDVTWGLPPESIGYWNEKGANVLPASSWICEPPVRVRTAPENEET